MTYAFKTAYIDIGISQPNRIPNEGVISVEGDFKKFNKKLAHVTILGLDLKLT